MRLPSLRNTMSLLKWHGWSAGLAWLPCFSLAQGLTTFNSLLALAIVSAAGLQSQFGRQKMNLVSFPLHFCHNSLILQVMCILWLWGGGDSTGKGVWVQYFNVLSRCTEQLHIQKHIISQEAVDKASKQFGRRKCKAGKWLYFYRSKVEHR